VVEPFLKPSQKKAKQNQRITIAKGERKEGKTNAKGEQNQRKTLEKQ
jgi:hypothetical protein